MGFDSIHNYYEKRVVEYLKRTLSKQITDEDMLADIACLALNKLPPRYIRYDVDMVFFTTPEEQKKMDLEMVQAIELALKSLEKRK
ncbi:MAG: late competence development ComFB family protein [Gammaproteobacteria bacterium]|nr:late competence development ComFB family protein [Gammaproteobacteria bacterium]